jgi:hypothetical protein
MPYRKRRASESLQHRGQRQSSDEDTLDLIQADRIVGAVIQLGRARRLVAGDLLRVLNFMPSLCFCRTVWITCRQGWRGNEIITTCEIYLTHRTY